MKTNETEKIKIEISRNIKKYIYDVKIRSKSICYKNEYKILKLIN